jgi:hypothetical protein
VENKQCAANKHLKKVVWEAKCSSADEYIATSNVWEVVGWRHGWHSSHIPALRNHKGQLVYEHEEIASLLSERFFAEEDSSPIPLHFPDDPAPREVRSFTPFSEAELDTLLRATANKLAPSSSGTGWSLLKRGWGVVKDHLLPIYNACFMLGHHPACWKKAKVVAIPKPDKPDYSLPKVHCKDQVLTRLVTRRLCITDY